MLLHQCWHLLTSLYHKCGSCSYSFSWTTQLLSTSACGDKFEDKTQRHIQVAFFQVSTDMVGHFMNVLCVVRAPCAATCWQPAQDDGGPLQGTAKGWKHLRDVWSQREKQTWDTWLQSGTSVWNISLKRVNTSVYYENFYWVFFPLISCRSTWDVWLFTHI